MRDVAGSSFYAGKIINSQNVTFASGTSLRLRLNRRVEIF